MNETIFKVQYQYTIKLIDLLGCYRPLLIVCLIFFYTGLSFPYLPINPSTIHHPPSTIDSFNSPIPQFILPFIFIHSFLSLPCPSFPYPFPFPFPFHTISSSPCPIPQEFPCHPSFLYLPIMQKKRNNGNRLTQEN